jgi:hypothetical protein
VKRGSERRDPPVEVEVHWDVVVPDALQRAEWENLWRRLLKGPQRELDEGGPPRGDSSAAAGHTEIVS